MRLETHDIQITMWMIEHGLCIKCCIRKSIPGQHLCAKCSGISFTSSASSTSLKQNKLINAAKSAKYQAMWIAEGRCSRCGKHPAEEGHTVCKQCLEDMKFVNLQVKLKSAIAESVGICNVCKKRAARPGRKSCGECAEIAAARRRNLRQQRFENGLCTECGKHKPIEKSKMCLECINKRKSNGTN